MRAGFCSIILLDYLYIFGCLPSLRPKESWLRNGVVNRSYPLSCTHLWFGCWSSLAQAEDRRGKP